MVGRTQSPSSINIFRQCPRKYYYSYIEKRPTKPSIHLVRGTIVHEALEHFFERPLHTMADKFTAMQMQILTLLKESWHDHAAEFNTLSLTAAELESYREETVLMMVNWVAFFWGRLQERMARGESFAVAFDALTPRREEEYKSLEHNIRGFIDAIHEHDGEVHIRDYKTSKHPVITDDYKLQLAIYAFLYKHNHGILPDSVGIFFLKHGEQIMEVNDALLEHAQREIAWVHERTQTDDMHEYPKRRSALCNYCDFYELCWVQKELPVFDVSK